MGNKALSKPKKPPPHKLYSMHGIQYMREKKDPTQEDLEQATSNGAVQGKLIREYSSVNGFEDVQWITSEYPFENIVMSGGGSKGYAYIGALKVRRIYLHDRGYSFRLEVCPTTPPHVPLTLRPTLS